MCPGTRRKEAAHFAGRRVLRLEVKELEEVECTENRSQMTDTTRQKDFKLKKKKMLKEGSEEMAQWVRTLTEQA